jgi:regulator of protease activity HflC (stomatin/prohibitin superfamily)
MLVLAVAGIATAGITWVPEGKRATVTRFGRHHRELGPGLHFTVPFIERVSEPGASNGA